MTFKFNNFSINTGTSNWVEITTTEDADMNNLSIPVLVVHGGEGPVLWMQGCVHGSEHSGSLALRDYLLNLDPKSLSGTIIGVPVVNRSAFAAKRRTSPIDDLDLNRTFPGDPTNSFTHKLAATLFNKITAHADYVVDLHTGGNQFLIPGYTIFAPTNNETERQSRQMCSAADLPYAVSPPLETFAGALYGEVAKKSIPAIVVEIGGEGRIRQHHLERTVEVVRNIPRQLGMLSEPVVRNNDVIFREKLSIARASVGGIFECNIEGNKPVEKGDLLAKITDIKGRTKQRLEAPYDAIPIAVGTYGVVRPGDWVFEFIKQ
jgi:predicted deacylase